MSVSKANSTTIPNSGSNHNSPDNLPLSIFTGRFEVLGAAWGEKLPVNLIRMHLRSACCSQFLKAHFKFRLRMPISAGTSSLTAQLSPSFTTRRGVVSSPIEPYCLSVFSSVSYTHLRAHETVLDLVC